MITRLATSTKLFLLGLCLSASVSAASLEYDRVVITLSDNGQILLDANIRYEFNDTIREALEHGVPLVFETHIELREAGSWIWSKDVIEHRWRTSLRYRPLSRLYEVGDFKGAEKKSFATLRSAMEALGGIEEMAIIERAKLDPSEEYKVRLQISLDIEALPLPMRPKAYVSADWNLASEPWEWLIKP